MLEALWSVEFVANTQTYGAGVVVLETGRVFGGDSQYYYVGEYNINPIATDTVHVELKVKHYSGAMYSIFGQIANFKVKLEGKYARDTFDIKGYLVENPSMKMVARLTRRAEIP